MIGDILKMIFYTGIGYGIIGTLVIEGIILIIKRIVIIRRRKKNAEKLAKAIQKALAKAIKEIKQDGE